MIKQIFHVFSGAMLFALSACATASEVADPVSSDIAEAERRFNKMAENYPALNAVVMVEGQAVWKAEGGIMRGPEDSVDTDYNIYSIAKMLTGLAYAKLDSDGAVNLDQSIRKIERRLPLAYQNVTLRHLLSHRGGVRHYTSDQDWLAFNDMRCAKPQDALGQFIEDPLDFDAGGDYSYSTYGFTLLSHLLVQLTETATYDPAMNKVLGEHYRAATDSDDAVKATNYIEENGGLKKVSLSAECKFGGGGLIASARDLAEMGSALAKGEIIPVEYAENNITPGLTDDGEEINYVYGMSVGASEKANSRYSMHSGGSPGGRAFLLVFYEPKIVVALTSNYDGPHHADLAVELAYIFAGLPPEEETEAADG